MKRIKIGIRREDKNKWEKRVPLTPEAMEEFQREHGLSFVVQTSPIRIFPDEDFKSRGIEIVEDLSDCDMIFAVKEIPVKLIQDKKVYAFFSHTIKGQAYTMPLLQRILDSKSTLVDYERIVDDRDRRLVFFGAHAGYAGMIDSLHLIGKRHVALGEKCRFRKVKMAYEYNTLEEAKSEIAKLALDIKENGILNTVIFGIAGYGNVSKGAQEILDLLPVVEITPEECLSLRNKQVGRQYCVYKVVFKEEHMAERIDGSPFELQTYYDKPELFQSKFEMYVPHLSVLINAIYWSEQYPRLVTKKLLKDLYKKGQHGPEVIADISIDIGGAIECSYKATHSDNPAYVYDPLQDIYIPGVEGKGPVILAVDNLPCEISRESSESFCDALKPFIPAMAAVDWSQDFDQLDLPRPIKTAIIVHKGELTPDYQYLKEFL
ncbi:MAG: hypothetical protein CSA81_06460 [Acidobacteria bacterium]|nr:MAG: hypothetical protein CSA81_06460 [Acidobacteriota bacterium]